MYLGKNIDKLNVLGGVYVNKYNRKAPTSTEIKQHILQSLLASKPSPTKQLHGHGRRNH